MHAVREQARACAVLHLACHGLFRSDNPSFSSLRLGDPFADAEMELGPVISAAQRERVLGFVDRAVAAGAEVLTGGSSWGDRGFFIEPTVVAGVEQSAEIIQQEVFGPVVTVQRAAGEEQGRTPLTAGCVRRVSNPLSIWRELRPPL